MFTKLDRLTSVISVYPTRSSDLCPKCLPNSIILPLSSVFYPTRSSDLSHKCLPNSIIWPLTSVFYPTRSLDLSHKCLPNSIIWPLTSVFYPTRSSDLWHQWFTQLEHLTSDISDLPNSIILPLTSVIYPTRSSYLCIKCFQPSFIGPLSSELYLNRSSDPDRMTFFLKSWTVPGHSYPGDNPSYKVRAW